MVITAAPNKVAVANGRYTAKVIIDVFLRVRSGERCADKDGAAGRDVREQAVLDAVAFAAVNGSSVG